MSPTAAAPEAPTEAAPETPEVPVSSAPSEVAGEQSPLVVPDVPELQEMVPGGDEMAQAEARAAEEAAARIFGIEIPGAPAAEAAEPSVAEAPATEPAPPNLLRRYLLRYPPPPARLLLPPPQRQHRPSTRTQPSPQPPSLRVPPTRPFLNPSSSTHRKSHQNLRQNQHQRLAHNRPHPQTPKTLKRSSL